MSSTRETAPDRPGTHRETRLLLLGGSSEIGLAIARRLVAEGAVRPFLLGRNLELMQQALELLESAGCTAGELGVLDADDLEAHGQVIGDAFRQSGGFDVVVLAIGVLGAQSGLDAEVNESLEVMRVNFVDCGSLLMHSLRELRSQGRGTLVVLSSVAAERPRASNPVYGAAKAGLDALAQGLADSTAGGGPHVLVVRPGFVITRMTAGLKPAPFATTPEKVAEAVVRGLERGAGTIWVPPSLRSVFSLLRHVPRPIYRRLPI